MDEAADVHIADLCIGDDNAQCVHFLVKKAFLHDFLPNTLFEGVVAVAAHIVVLLALQHTAVEIVVGHLVAVQLGKSLLVTVLLKVADDKSNDSYTHNGNCYPRMFSNVSNNSHLLLYFYNFT